MTTTRAIEIIGLTKTYADTPVLRGVHLSAPAGSVVALLGSNGAGKTTIVRILSTLLRADGGSARINGHDVATEPEQVRRAGPCAGLGSGPDRHGQAPGADPARHGQRAALPAGPQRKTRRPGGDPGADTQHAATPGPDHRAKWHRQRDHPRAARQEQCPDRPGAGGGCGRGQEAVRQGQADPGAAGVLAQVPPPGAGRRDARFRRQRVAVGKLVGAELQQVTDAYVWAYFMAGSARNELRSWADTPQDIPALWNGFVDHPEAALGHWFGHKVPGRTDARQIMDRLQDVLEAWTSAFSHGFRAGFPVFIRRKERDPVLGSPSARHVARNTVELMPEIFDLGPESQAAILLHEMGHWAIGMKNPRDERHNLCDGGWNRKENMCYHAGKSDLRSEGQLLRGGNPRTLAESFDSGNTGAGKTARNNIDNYVAFMWNRFVDRDDSVLYVPPSGSGRPAKAAVGKGKPVN